MFDRDDTIVAIATPPGRGGIGIVRVSGPAALRIASHVAGGRDRFEPRRATLVHARGANGLSDQAIITSYPAPGSYTGEDIVEISLHGSQVLLRSIVEAAVAAGARLAEPGEFTFRAYLNGKIDLVQAEAVRDLVDAVTPLQARAAYDQLDGTLTSRIAEIDRALLDLTARLEASMDFPDEGYHFLDPDAALLELRGVADRVTALLTEGARGRMVREGAAVVIAGCPNSGKSSLFNRLAGEGRAIVTDVPGTTRDLITERVDVRGVPVTLVDTAGIREAAADPIEAEGMSRSRSAQAAAELVLVVLDRSRPLSAADHYVLALTERTPRVVVGNKSDLPDAWRGSHENLRPLTVSARTGEGVDALREEIAAALQSGEARRDVPAITNLRHVTLLTRAREALDRAAEAVAIRTPEEFVAVDIGEARRALEEITGARTPDDILRTIFENFCIGK